MSIQIRTEGSLEQYKRLWRAASVFLEQQGLVLLQGAGEQEGSWQEWIFGCFKKAPKSKDVQELTASAKRAVEQALVEAQQAEINAKNLTATASMIEAMKGTGRNQILIGNIMILSDVINEEQCFNVFELTPEQMIQVRRVKNSGLHLTHDRVLETIGTGQVGKLETGSGFESLELPQQEE